MFTHYFSLGYRCSTAASLQKLGVRDTSGPFDWYFSPLDKVLLCIENHFENLLLPENILLDPEYDHKFTDILYDFVYYHEKRLDGKKGKSDKTVMELLPIIRERYNRRINRFYEFIKEPTCFIRAVKTPNEISYINTNEMKIVNLLKKYNPQNEFIYIIPQTFLSPNIQISFKNYYLVDKYLTSDGGSGELILRNKALTNYILSSYIKFAH